MSSEHRIHWGCDRCGRNVDIAQQNVAPNGWGAVAYTASQPASSPTETNWRRFHLCPHCKTSFTQWLDHGDPVAAGSPEGPQP